MIGALLKWLTPPDPLVEKLERHQRAYEALRESVKLSLEQQVDATADAMARIGRRKDDREHS